MTGAVIPLLKVGVITSDYGGLPELDKFVLS
jgi:hypothetical protein